MIVGLGAVVCINSVLKFVAVGHDTKNEGVSQQGFELLEVDVNFMTGRI